MGSYLREVRLEMKFEPAYYDPRREQIVSLRLGSFAGTPRGDYDQRMAEHAYPWCVLLRVPQALHGQLLDDWAEAYRRELQKLPFVFIEADVAQPALRLSFRDEDDLTEFRIRLASWIRRYGVETP